MCLTCASSLIEKLGQYQGKDLGSDSRSNTREEESRLGLSRSKLIAKYWDRIQGLYLSLNTGSGLKVKISVGIRGSFEGHRIEGQI